MDDEPRTNAGASEDVSAPLQSGKTDLPATGGSTAGGDPEVVPGQPAANALTKEEQWALFEKELMENDWGHQPC